MAYAATEPVPALHPSDAHELRHRVKAGNVLRIASFLGEAALAVTLGIVAGSALADRTSAGPHLCTYTVDRGDTLANFADMSGANMADLRRWNSLGPNATIIYELGSVVAPCVEGAGGEPIAE